MSPELLHPEVFGFEDSRPTKASDCYALGMVILEVLSGQAPFAGDKDFIVMRKVIEGGRPERPDGAWFTNVLWMTLEECWLPRPEDRPAIEAVLECLGPLSVAWQPLPHTANGDVKDFNDSRSTLGGHRTFFRFISNFRLKRSCRKLNNSPGYRSFTNSAMIEPASEGPLIIHSLRHSFNRVPNMFGLHYVPSHENSHKGT